MLELISNNEIDPAARDEVLALAAVAQAVTAVHEIARSGHVDEDALLVAASSTLRIDSESVSAIFGGAPALRRGLDALCKQLRGPRTPAMNEAARYAAGALKLARDMLRHPEVANNLKVQLERITALSDGADAPALTDDLVVDELASAYQDFVSTLGPRIMVFGAPEVLEQPRNAARVRVLLLGAVRAALLWQQLGGSRLRLILSPGYRTRLHDTARALADSVQNE